MKERKPIFYDAEKIRWRFTRRILEVSGVLLTLLLVYFFVTIAGSVELPSSLLPDTRPSLPRAEEKALQTGGGPRRAARDASRISVRFLPNMTRCARHFSSVGIPTALLR